MGTVTMTGTPKIWSAAEAPANSPTVLARLAMSSTTIANSVQRTPKRSRMRSERPWPVMVPSREAISCTTDRTTTVMGKSHSSA